jgi:LPPG:FO 2-phospho-L-lactate transferase
MTVVVLSGGVGGAKLVCGLAEVLPGDKLTVVVNTGDDFTHLGLPISPDIDSVLYALAGKSDPVRGWGREGESWECMKALGELGGPNWFQLGDRDLATHLFRLEQRLDGQALSAITKSMACALGIDCTVLPMSDDAVATQVVTNEGVLCFQDYFVRRRCEPPVRSLFFEGAHHAKAAPGVVEAIKTASTIIIAPSNPWLSIDPILALPDVSAALREASAPIVAVSPLIDGRAVKGPTAKIMAELGLASTNLEIALKYAPWLSGLLLDTGDSPEPMPVPTARTAILMQTSQDKERVAQAALAFAASLAA